MPSTFVHGFLPATCLAASKGGVPKLTAKQWLWLYGIAFIAGNMPDLDLIPGLIWNDQWSYYHRNMGHNIFALVGWATLTRFLLCKFVSPEFKGRRGWVISIALVSSHVLFDAMGGSIPGDTRHGVPLLYPFSTWEFLMPIEAFQAYELGDSANPLMAHVKSVSFWKKAFLAEIAVSTAIFSLWCISYHAGRLALRLRKQPSPQLSSESKVA